MGIAPCYERMTSLMLRTKVIIIVLRHLGYAVLPIVVWIAGKVWTAYIERTVDTLIRLTYVGRLRGKVQGSKHNWWY